MSDEIEIILETTLLEVEIETVVRGARGEDGLSAYQVALANGFVGTEAQWLASLEGAQGIQGIQGEKGDDGAPADIIWALIF